MFNYDWSFTDYPKEKNGLKVFSTFACGGGSTMGYKLAGFDVIGANDIDPQMAKVYQHNHHPKYYFLNPITELLDMELPDELYNLDILDGSPPCSTFSMAGQREKGWKVEKKFKEGQSKQVLSDLFFEFIKLAGKLQPKVIIAENVKGMLIGNAKAYTKLILEGFGNIGYNTQLFLLNGATMGLPQKRERVFFICTRKDLELPKIKLQFVERPIFFNEISDNHDIKPKISPLFLQYWNKAKQGESMGKFFSTKKLSHRKVANTITAGDHLFHPTIPRKLNLSELRKCGSFPIDYDYLDVNPGYLIGMSVPPIMTANIAKQIEIQVFIKM